MELIDFADEILLAGNKNCYSEAPVRIKRPSPVKH